MGEKTAAKKISGAWGRKLKRLVFFVTVVFVSTGISLSLIECCVLPRIAATKWLSDYSFFKAATEKVFVVNKTEQVTISEDETVARYSSKASPSVVEIISYKKEFGSLQRIGDKSLVKRGSGLAVTADGLVLTYRSAIFSDSAEYKIFTSAEKFFEARLVATDEFSNLAFLKIDNVGDLPTTSFISPEDIRTGAKVVAVGRSGSAFQVVFKAGLISQFSHDFSLAGPLASSEKMQGVFLLDFPEQADAAGDAVLGGAVVDYNGNVMGTLGSRVTSEKNQYFLIPADQVADLVDRFLNEGSMKRGSLGVYSVSLSKESASVLGLKRENGALIFSPGLQQGLAVISGSAAEKSGLKIFDIITAVNEEEVDMSQNLSRLISKYKPGDTVDINFLRDGREMKAKAVLQ